MRTIKLSEIESKLWDQRISCKSLYIGRAQFHANSERTTIQLIHHDGHGLYVAHPIMKDE